MALRRKKNPLKTVTLGNSERKLVWVAQHREEMHNYDGIEPKAVLCNTGQSEGFSPDKLLLNKNVE